MFKRLLIGSGIALALLLVYFFWQIARPAQPIVVSPQTTVITAPLATDGLPDYSAYLLGKMKEGVTPENNGAIPFLQAMWPAGLNAKEQAIVCAELEMEIPQRQGLQQPDQDEALLRELANWLGIYRPTQEELDMREWPEDDGTDEPTEEDYLYALDDRPWTTDEAPVVADWLDSHREQFDLLHQAAQRERFYFPSPTLLTDSTVNLLVLPLPDSAAMHRATALLQFRANLLLGSGDLAGAWRDCRAIYQLTDFRTHPFPVSEMTSHTCASRSNATLIRILESPDLTPELASEIARYLDQRKPQHDMITALREGEHLMLVTSALELANIRPSTQKIYGLPLEDAQQPSLPIEWNEVLRASNDQYELLLQAWEQPTYQLRCKAIDAWHDQLPNMDRDLQGFSDHLPLVISRDARSEYMTGLMLSTIFTGPLDSEDRYHTNKLLHRVAVAIALYKLENGSFPNSLTDLAPAHLAAIPLDLFGNSLVYHQTPDGYLLYSLGPDGKDQGGSNRVYRYYKGYATSDTEEQDKLLRSALNQPRNSLSKGLLTPPTGSDDIAIRLPLIHRPLPKFEPSGN